MQRHHLVPALLLFACTDRPAIETADSTASTTDESTSAAPTSDPPTGTTTSATDTAPTDTGVTDTSATDTGTTEAITSDTGTTGPGTTATTTTATTGTDTTDGTTTGLTATDTGSSSTGEPPPPGVCARCDALIDLDGPIIIDPTTDLSQFACLGTVTGHVTISGDLTAEQLAPLCHLRIITSSLKIQNNAVLTDLSPFAALERADVLRLLKLPALTAVSGMTSLKKTFTIEIDETGAKTLGDFAPDFEGIQSLTIRNNVFTDLSGLAGWGLLAPSQSIGIHDSAALTDLSSLADLFAAAGDGFSFELVDAPALTSLTGLGVASKGHYQLRELPLITDLKPLAQVKTLGGLWLRGLPLKDLEGLGALQSARLQLWDMPTLGSLDGLGPLTSGVVELLHLPKLASLQGLESFTTGDLMLLDLPLVPSLAPLGAYTGGNSVDIYGLPLVTSLTGLDKLQSAKSVMIGDCVNEGLTGMASLTSLKGLGALTTVDEFMVTNSPKLTSLAGADKLAAVSERLAIINNPKLPKAAFDAFIAKVAEPPMTCFGDWGVCDCIDIQPP